MPKDTFYRRRNQERNHVNRQVFNRKVRDGSLHNHIVMEGIGQRQAQFERKERFRNLLNWGPGFINQHETWRQRWVEQGKKVPKPTNRHVYNNRDLWREIKGVTLSLEDALEIKKHYNEYNNREFNPLQ